MNLTAGQVAGLSSTLLAGRYDSFKTTPKFHHELWDTCCSARPYVAIAAPRGHAKSTAVTHAFVLACVLLREKRYVLIISDTEEQATEFLGDLKNELRDNDDLRQLFGVSRLIKDAVTDCIVEMDDGWRFRIKAFGAEQKVRGRKWGGTRPDLIIGDDLENDEIVENADRREKFRFWFFKAVLPTLSDNGHIRIVGTILHMDSLLERLLNNSSWLAKRYKAHAGFNDFSEILWIEKFPEARLREIRQNYIDEGMPEAYSQEFLNDPIDQAQAYFRRGDFLEMDAPDFKSIKNYYIGMDFAISDADRADYTVIVVGGMDDKGRLHVVDVRRGRWDAKEILDEMFFVQKRYDPVLFTVEDGAIYKSIGPELFSQSILQNMPINLNSLTPSKDKRSRARSIQARMRAGGVFFDKNADWYPTFEEELLHFPKGKKKDQVDAFAYIGLGLAQSYEAPSFQQMQEEEELIERNLYYTEGRNATTGY